MLNEENQAEQRPAKKPRRDKGRILLTPRDLVVLRWIGEQYSVRLDQLQRLLARETEVAPEKLHTPGLVAEGTAQRVMTRWVQAGWAEQGRFLHREPAWVWLTRKGLDHIGLTYRYMTPKVSTLPHLYWMNQVRLFVEQQWEEVVWRGERQLRAKQAYVPGGHYVDAEIDLQGKVIGLEVELTAKKQAELTKILLGLLSHYEVVWYFTTSVTDRLVREVVGELPAPQRQVFRIKALEELQ